MPQRQHDVVPASGRSEVAGAAPRRAHDLRRTLISMAQGAKCNREAVKACTHGSKGDIIDDYTTWAWDDQCAAISCVAFELPRTDRDLRLATCFARPCRIASGMESRGSHASSAGCSRCTRAFPRSASACSVKHPDHSKIGATPTGIENGRWAGQPSGTAEIRRKRAGARSLGAAPGTSAWRFRGDSASHGPR
jgi:hypothetical protein